jgi:predicted TIM-barrel fold metal-dependent hydrolase
MNFSPSDKVAVIRQAIDHPVIDSDGHLIEYLPLVRDFLVEEAGERVATGFDRMVKSALPRLAVRSPADRRQRGIHATGVWGLPTKNTLDRATAMLPKLQYRRLDELGIDFAVLYPTYGLPVTALVDQELRCGLARSVNRYYAEVYAGYRDRLEPVAAIPTFTPGEAVDELDHAVGELGLKAVMLGGALPRPYDAWPESPGRWIDTLGHDSLHDYDPLWRRCEELGVVPTFHAGGQGWGTRMSTTNNSYNQVGNFAAADEGTCRSLVFGGVPMRFPRLRFAFQEGGVAWAAALLAGIIAHYEKRNREAIAHYSPAGLDRRLLRKLFDDYSTGAVAARPDRLDEALVMLSDPDELPQDVDMFGESGLASVDNLLDIFANRFFFGCEADDPMNALAFSPSLSPGKIQLPAVFASDIGHWDVRDMRDVVPEAYELVEQGHLDAEQFRAFVFENPVRLWAGGNPRFFGGTVLEGDVAELTGS